MILIVDEEQSIRETLAQALYAWNYQPVAAATAAEALSCCDDARPVAVLLAAHLADAPALEVLRELKRRTPEVVVIITTNGVHLDDLMTILRAGAHDFISQPFNLAELEARIRRQLDPQPAQMEVDAERKSHAAQNSFDQIIGQSPAMQEMLSVARKVAESEVSSVLLQGESGTGKDLLAKAIHNGSSRAAHPFVAINCAALPPNLIESELFGHEKGAFTDARARKEGLLEQDGGGGTIFLDEISELEINLQAKLLRVLEEGCFRRVGGLKDVPFSARVIAAANRDLKRESEAGRFRPDLYYRLAVIQIDLPPLRERSDDVLLLAQHFIPRNGPQNINGLTPEAACAFQSYDWPGNVRELKNVVERALILEDGDMISTSYLPRGIVSDTVDTAARRARMSVVERDATVSLPHEGISLNVVEAALLKQALARSGGNQTRAAELLGLSRDQFRYRWKKLNGMNQRRPPLLAMAGGAHN
ncbi:MAG TPA: sigma-54 dependent transcriptional regulator [Pyrinomonadaceae bacterium]|jgi:DNA-binding NtrC family response regulator|nr:sigma-54 dependent transcriptional regulator [Pyrinomonadaceae bacterium]